MRRRDDLTAAEYLELRRRIQRAEPRLVMQLLLETIHELGTPRKPADRDTPPEFARFMAGATQIDVDIDRLMQERSVGGSAAFRRLLRKLRHLQRARRNRSPKP